MGQEKIQLCSLNLISLKIQELDNWSASKFGGSLNSRRETKFRGVLQFFIKYKHLLGRAYFRRQKVAC